MKRTLLLLNAILFGATLAFAQTPTATFTPTPTPTVTAIMVMPATITIPVGTLVQLFGLTTPQGVAATWTSSNSSVAALTSGAPVSAQFVTGVAAGTATVTATINGHSSSCTVTVVAPQPTATPT